MMSVLIMFGQKQQDGWQPVDVFMRDCNNRTVLHHAASANNQLAIEFLSQAPGFEEALDL